MLKRRKPKRRKSLRVNLPRIGCPFCWEWLPSPKPLTNVFTAYGCQGGRCAECGAYYVVDDTGKSGGQALLDVQAFACDGDMDRALLIREGVDFELKTREYGGESASQNNYVRGHSHMQPQAWVLRLTKK